MTCTIQLKPMLQEFVVNAWLGGTNKVSAGDPFGKIIKPLLTKPPQGYIPLMRSMFDGEGSFTFELPNYNNKNTDRNFYISEINQHYIEQLVKLLMQQVLILYLQKIHSDGMQIKSAILSFCEFYNLQKIEYDTLKKMQGWTSRGCGIVSP